MPSLGPVVLATGTQITCPLGHTVCVVAREIRSHEPLALEMFERWQGAPPRLGESFPRCRVCGSEAQRGKGDEIELHTPAGWHSLKGSARAEPATKGDIDDAEVRLLEALNASGRRFETLLWKHTIGIILNVLVMAAILLWLFR